LRDVVAVAAIAIRGSHENPSLMEIK